MTFYITLIKKQAPTNLSLRKTCIVPGLKILEVVGLSLSNTRKVCFNRRELFTNHSLPNPFEFVPFAIKYR